MINDLIQILNKNKFEYNREPNDYILFEFFYFINENKVDFDFDIQEDNIYGVIYLLKKFIHYQIDKEFKDLNISYEIYNFNSISSSTQYIYSYIINFYLSKSILYEKELAYNYLLLEDEKNEKTFILKITNNKEWIYYFFKKYPVCYFLISNFIEKQINYLKEIIYHLEKDNKQLFNVFDIKGKITCIELAKGDLHRDNRSVCKIYFEKGTIFYKPRGFKIDKLINEVLLKVETILRIPKFIDKSTYGYCENILNNEEIINKDSSKTLNYFFELGKVIRIINDLQIEDIINDNIIHSNGYLYLIDIESVFVPKVVYKSNLHGFFNLLEMHSPLSTGTIPNRQGVFEYSNSIILPSKISSDGKIKKIKNQDFFNHNFVRTESDTHLPTFYSIDSTLHFEKYCEILKKGYSKNQLSNLNINSIINEINKFEVRVIFRETVKYFQLLMHCRTPDFLVSTKKYLNELAVILPSNEKDVDEFSIQNSEFKQLKEGDIPIFSIKNGNLLDHLETTIIPNYYELSQRKININKSYDFGKLIEETLLLQLPDKNYFSTIFSPIKNKIINREIYDIQNHIFHFLVRSNQNFPEKNAILTTYINEEKLIMQDQFVTNISIMRPGFYEGVDGVLFSLYNWCFRNKKEYLFWDTMCNLHNEQLMFSQNNILSDEISNGSFFSSPFSGILTILREHNKKKNIDINRYISGFMKKTRIILKENKLNDISFYSGISSTCLFVCNNEYIFKKSGELNQFYNEIQSFLSNLLNENFLKNKRDELSEWSISGNHSGVLILLNILNKKNIINSKLKMIRSTYLDDLKKILKICIDIINKPDTNRSWLKGVNGVFATALASDYKLYKDELIKFYNFEKENSNHTSFSLSGGNLGGLVLLQAIDKKFNLNSICKNEQIYFKDLFNLDNDDLVKSMLPKGLFNGITGFMEFDKIEEGNNILIPDFSWMKDEYILF